MTIEELIEVYRDTRRVPFKKIAAQGHDLKELMRVAQLKGAHSLAKKARHAVYQHQWRDKNDGR